MKRRTFLAATTLCASMPTVWSQPSNWPARPIQFTVGLAAGGGTDVVARAIASKLTQRTEWRTVVENKAGASGAIAARAVASAEPNGYTLLVGTIGTQIISPLLQKDAGFKPIEDFTPVSLIGATANILAVSPTIPAKSVETLVQYLKERPGSISYATTGLRTMAHLAGEMFQKMTGTSIVHVPYRGEAAAFPDLIAGRVQMIFASPVSLLPHLKSGSVTAIANSGGRRLSVLPDLPTFEEAGLKGYQADIWMGVFAPARTPPDVIRQLNSQIDGVIQSAEFRDQMSALGFVTIGGPPETMAATVASDLKKWSGVIKEAGVQPE